MSSQFSLFAIVMIHTVTSNTELANSELELLGKIQVKVPARYWSQHFHQSSIRILVFSVFLFKDTLFNMYCLFITLNLQSTAPQVMSE